MNTTDRRIVASWLLLCAGMVFAMVVVGGVTRLTHSGLSIVEWQPLVGTLPPLNETEWQSLFEKYRKTPEFKQVNFDIDLAGFKRIFWWEYFHRLLGRTIGLVFLLPFLWFLLRRLCRAVGARLGNRVSLVPGRALPAHRAGTDHLALLRRSVSCSWRGARVAQPVSRPQARRRSRPAEFRGDCLALRRHQGADGGARLTTLRTSSRKRCTSPWG